MIFQLEDRVFLARRRHSHLLRALFRWASRDRLYNRRKHDPPRLHSRPGNQLFMQDSLLRILDGRFFFHERDSIGFESLESCVKNQNRERSESNNVEKANVVEGKIRSAGWSLSPDVRQFTIPPRNSSSSKEYSESYSIRSFMKRRRKIAHFEKILY